jgi:serine protease Do
MVQPDGSTVEMNAQTLAASPADDIAVLQVEANNLPVLEFGDPTSLEVGDWIIAIGSPFGLDHTATVGVVSALGRRFKVPDDRQAMPVERIYDDMIQTDAAINSGNSGGPLINLAGDVVGMNTLITSPSGASAGVGFAISASKLRVVVENLLGEAVVGFRWKIVDPRWLEGAEAPEGHYVQIRDVAPRAPAAAAGLREDDLILSIGGTDIREPADIRAALQDAEPGDTLEMDVFRYAPGDGGRRETLDVTVVSRGDL